MVISRKAVYSNNPVWRYIQEKITPPQDFMNEISSSESSYFGGYKPPAYNPDDLVSREGITIYEKMQKNDEQIKACLMIKKLGILANGYQILPAENKEPYITHANFIKYNNEKIKGTIEKKIFDICSAFGYGFSISEKILSYIQDGEFKGKWAITDIKNRKPHNFDFQTDSFGNLLNITQWNGKKSFDPQKFIIYVYNKEFDNWYGQSDLRCIYKNYYAKDLLTKFWNVYLERFGMPPIVGRHEGKLDKESRELFMSILNNIQSKTSLIIPKSLEVDIPESGKGAGQLGYERAIDYHNSAIAKGILVPGLIGFNKVEGGSFALGKKHFDTFLLVLKFLQAELAEEVIGEQYIRWLIDWNFGVIDKYPVWKFGALDDDDQKLKSEMAEIWVNAGLISPEEDWVREYLGIPAREEGTILPTPKPKIQQFKEINVPTKLKRRKFTTYEEKVDFKEILNTGEDLVSDTLDSILQITNESIAELKSDVLKIKVVKDIEKLHIKYTGDLKRIFEDMFNRAYKKGGKQVNSEIQSVKKFASLDIRKLPPKQALAWFKAQAFKMAGDLSDWELSNAKDILYAGLKAGKSVDDMVFDLDTFFKSITYSGETNPETGSAFTPSRLETIIRTNSGAAMNMGRLNQMLDPNLDGFVEAVQYSAILDDRTTEICEKLDGLVMKTNDPELSKANPPMHYNCRSMLIPITAEESYNVSTAKDWNSGIELVDVKFGGEKGQ